MPSTAWDTQQIGNAPPVAAPDGSEVRVLCATPCGSMALFTLPAGGIARPVVHRTVEEIWYVVAGKGRIWRRLGGAEEVADLVPGLSLTIPAGTAFQFRNDGEARLDIVGVTMPPWPGADEADAAAGKWTATL
jgi:mannose-6-phosphate isomerase-like protein (cupin superfamily)